MRVLVADRDVALLEAVARTFGNHFSIETATHRAECVALLEQCDFDLIIVCEKLADGPGLSLLSYVVRQCPDTLRVLAARTSRLKLLKGRLGHFGLFRTLSYPIDPRKLLSILALARAGLEIAAPALTVQHVVLEDEWTGEQAPAVLDEQPPQDTNTAPVRARASVPALPPPRTSAPSSMRAPGATRRQRPALPALPQSAYPVEVQVESDTEVTITAVQRVVPVQHEPTSQQRVEATRARPTQRTPQAATPRRAAARDTTPQRRASQSASTPTATQLMTSRSASGPRTGPTRTATQRMASLPAPQGFGPQGEALAAAARTPGGSSQSVANENGAPRRVTSEPGVPRRVTSEPGAPRQLRQPSVSQRVAFQRALAKRNAAQGSPDAAPERRPARGSPGTQRAAKTVRQPGQTQQSAPTSSLSDLARASATPRPLYEYVPRGTPNRAQLFVGAGLIVSLGAVVLTLKLLSGDNSIAPQPPGPAAQLVPGLSSTQTIFSSSRPQAAPSRQVASQQNTQQPGQPSAQQDPAADMRPLEPELAMPIPPPDPGEPPMTPANFEPMPEDPNPN